MPRGRSVAEWVTLTISLMLLLGLVSLVIALTLENGGEPPTLEAEALLAETRYAGGKYYLLIAVTNHGDVTAQEVRIRAELVLADRAFETAEFTIDILASGEDSQGTVVFVSDPKTSQLMVSVESFR